MTHREASSYLPLRERLTDAEKLLLVAWFRHLGELPPDAIDLYGLRAAMFDALCADPKSYLAKAQRWRDAEKSY